MLSLLPWLGVGVGVLLQTALLPHAQLQEPFLEKRKTRKLRSFLLTPREIQGEGGCTLGGDPGALQRWEV